MPSQTNDFLHIINNFDDAKQKQVFERKKQQKCLNMSKNVSRKLFNAFFLSLSISGSKCSKSNQLSAKSNIRKSQWAQIDTQIDSKYFHNREKSLTAANTQCTHISWVIKLFNPSPDSVHLLVFSLHLFSSSRMRTLYSKMWNSHCLLREHFTRGVFDEHFYAILNIKIIVCKAHPLAATRAMMINADRLS